MLGFYRDNGKYNGNYYNKLVRCAASHHGPWQIDVDPNQTAEEVFGLEAMVLSSTDLQYFFEEEYVKSDWPACSLCFANFLAEVELAVMVPMQGLD